MSHGRSNTVRLYVVLCAIAAAAAAILAIREPQSFSWAAILGFGLLALATAQFPIALTIAALYDISFVITIAALVSSGPGTAVIATALAIPLFRGAIHRPLIRHAFNLAQLTISAGACGIVYVHAGGWVGARLIEQSSGHEFIAHVFLPLIAATLTIFVVNTALVAGVIALSDRSNFLSLWRRNYGDLTGTYIAFALLGLLIAVLRSTLGWSLLIFAIMPLLVARHAFQAAFTMQGAYDETVKGLVAAIEAKDPYTRGHAQRVSQLSEMTARAYGLSEERCRAIRYSALMHDVGKLGVWNKVLKKPGKLTPEEYEHMKDHPVLGVEIVSEIDLLQEAIDGVRHHHERMDGHGYPDGLKGEDIPLFARLIMVCDAFDSMTSTRVYRVAKTIEEAFVELRRCAGTQFDEACLAALEKAVARHGWEPIGREELEQEPAPLEGPAEIGKGPNDGSQAASI
jgi:putative nucleotidyltransferase with HDIG domain